MAATKRKGSSSTASCESGKRGLNNLYNVGSMSLARTFADTVSGEILNKLGPDERQRQGVIFELISTEIQYNRDLEIIDKVINILL